MAEHNLAILEKADFQTSDLSSNGGYLVEEQAKKFIILAIKEGVLTPLMTAEPMNSHKKELDNLRFGSRVLHGATEGSALPDAQVSVPDIGKATLSVELFKAEVSVTDEVYEDNIEKAGLRQTIRTQLAKRIGSDIEDVVLNGDTTSADTLLGKLDGIRKQITTNTVAGGSVAPSIALLDDLVNAISSEFVRDRKAMRWITSVKAAQSFRSQFAQRMTQLGDQNLVSNLPVIVHAIALVEVPLYPENLGGSTNETEIILADPKNFHMGFYRKVRLEEERDKRAGATSVIATLRADVKIAHEPATAKAEAVLVG